MMSAVTYVRVLVRVSDRARHVLASRPAEFWGRKNQVVCTPAAPSTRHSRSVLTAPGDLERGSFPVAGPARSSRGHRGASRAVQPGQWCWDSNPGLCWAIALHGASVRGGRSRRVCARARAGRTESQAGGGAGRTDRGPQCIRGAGGDSPWASTRAAPSLV